MVRGQHLQGDWRYARHNRRHVEAFVRELDNQPRNHPPERRWHKTLWYPIKSTILKDDLLTPSTPLGRYLLDADRFS